MLCEIEKESVGVYIWVEDHEHRCDMKVYIYIGTHIYIIHSSLCCLAMMDFTEDFMQWAYNHDNVKPVFVLHRPISNNLFI